MSLVSAFLGSVFGVRVGIHISEVEQPVGEGYGDRRANFSARPDRQAGALLVKR